MKRHSRESIAGTGLAFSLIVSAGGCAVKHSDGTVVDEYHPSKNNIRIQAIATRFHDLRGSDKIVVSTSHNNKLEIETEPLDAQYPAGQEVFFARQDDTASGYSYLALFNNNDGEITMSCGSTSLNHKNKSVLVSEEHKVDAYGQPVVNSLRDDPALAVAQGVERASEIVDLLEFNGGVDHLQTLNDICNSVVNPL